MANTISNISLANTFGDWVSTTVQVVNELNYIGNSDWTKPSGTIFLQSNGTSLDVSNTTFFRGAVTIVGPNSGLTVHRNQSIFGTLNLTNTEIGSNPNKVILSANGVANINYVNIVGTGLAANVSNNMSIGGTLSITGNTTSSSNLVVIQNITSNNQTINYNLDIGQDLSVSNDLTVDNDLSIGGNLTTTSNTLSLGITSIGEDLFVYNNTITNFLISNTDIVSETLTVNDKITTDSITSNTDIYTQSLYLNNIQANSSVNVQTLSVVNSADINFLQVNTSINTTDTITSNNLFANTLVQTPTVNTTTLIALNLQANNSVNTSYANVNTISVNNKATVGELVSNTNIIANSGIVSAANVNSSNDINFANGVIGVGGTNGTTSIIAASASFGNISVTNNFTIFGSTIYNSDTLTVNSSQTVNANAFFTNYRPGGANASIRWFESGRYWDLRDVNNPTIFNRILTANDYVSINTSIITANTQLKNYVDTQITATAVSANAVITKANTDNILYTNAQISANAVSANAVITKANTDLKNYTDSTFVKLTSASQTIGGDITVTGNLAVNGTTTTIDTQTLVVEDSLIKLAKDNTASDSLDIGFYGVYQTGGLTRYTGLFRKAADKYYLAQAITTDPTSNTISNFGTGYRATLDANFTGGTVSGLSSPISVSDGGTGVSSSTGTGVLTLNTSPIFSGTPTAPTAANGTYSTVLSTTAFVLNQLNNKISGSTVVNDTTSSDTLYLLFTANTSGNLSSSRVSTTKLSYQPSTGTVSATNFNSTSDIRYKENIVKIENATDTVNLLNGVSFDWKETGTKSFGVIAQEIEKVLPELVGVSGEGKSVNYLGIIAFLINSVKELDERVKKLEKE